MFACYIYINNLFGKVAGVDAKIFLESYGGMKTVTSAWEIIITAQF